MKYVESVSSQMDIFNERIIWYSRTDFVRGSYLVTTDKCILLTVRKIEKSKYLRIIIVASSDIFDSVSR